MVCAPQGSITNQAYNHIALTYDRATGVAKIYANGLLVGSANVGDFTVQTSYDLYFGFRAGGNLAGTRFVGAMDEGRVYSRPLSATEVSQLYELGP